MACANNRETSPPSSLNRAVIAGAIGNFVECFDWFAYALFASYLSRLVFPSGDPLGRCFQHSPSLPSAFRAAAGELHLRNLCGSVWPQECVSRDDFPHGHGKPDDRDRPVLLAGGLVGPAMLLLARLMQGLAMGGETSSGGSYIVESAPSHRRGFSGSFFYISVGLGTLCASLTGTFLTYLLPKDQMESYGWRLVFVLGALLGIFGLYLRRSIGESEVFKRAARTTSKKTGAACAPSCSIIGRACCESFSLRSARRWRSISGLPTFPTCCEPVVAYPHRHHFSRARSD